MFNPLAGFSNWWMNGSYSKALEQSKYEAQYWVGNRLYTIEVIALDLDQARQRVISHAVSTGLGIGMCANIRRVGAADASSS